jgi:hypothetical protein
MAQMRKKSVKARAMDHDIGDLRWSLNGDREASSFKRHSRTLAHISASSLVSCSWAFPPAAR